VGTALEITGTTSMDGDRWYVEDPLSIDLTVTDPDGGTLSDADVTVALIPDDDPDAVEDEKTVTTGASGEVSTSLAATETGAYTVVAGATAGNRRGYATLARHEVFPRPPFNLPGLTIPSLSGATASSSGTTTLSASVGTDTAQGDLALVAVTTTQPSDDQILNGQNANGNAAAFAKTIQPSSTGTQSFTPDGLNADTQYDLYWIQDVSGTRSSVASATATTDALTAPTLTSPSASGTGSNTGDGSVETDKATGTLYWIATTSGSTPTPTQIKNGNRADGTAADDSGSQSVSSTGTQSVSASGLSPSSVYTFYFVHENSVGDSSVVFASFSTSSSTLGASISLTDNDPSISVTGNASGGTSPYSYSWTFGDGATATGENASHTYNADGAYTVELTVTDDVGSTATASTSVTITGADVAAPTSLSTTGGTKEVTGAWTSTADSDAAQETLYRDTSANVDPQIATAVTTVQSPSAGATQSFTDTGVTGGQTYYYVVQVEDTSGNTALSNEVQSTPSTSDKPASAAFTVDESGDPTISVDGSGSGGDSPLSFSWDWGDGSPTGSGVTATHTYSDDGSFAVELTVTDDNGDTDTATKTVSIEAVAPDAPTNLSASSASGPSIDLSWDSPPDTDIDFYEVHRSVAGQGSYSEIDTTTNTSYSDTNVSAGESFDYKVRAVDTSGSIGSFSNVATASISTIPLFTFDASPNEVQDGQDVTFTVAGDGEGDAYTVEIIDTGTGQVFTTLSWTGSQYEGTVTINGTKGDSWTFEAKKTRDSDGVTKRSDNQETVSIPAGEEPTSASYDTSTESLSWSTGVGPSSTTYDTQTEELSWQ
jgi:chitodextrinase